MPQQEIPVAANSEVQKMVTFIQDRVINRKWSGRNARSSRNILGLRLSISELREWVDVFCDFKELVAEDREKVHVMLGTTKKKK
jgi:hypothetical protein